VRTRELPPPLPPGERTVGQVIAETIRNYGDRFWRVLPLGIPVAIVDQLSVREHPGIQMLVWWAATPLFVAAYLYACSLVLDARPNRTAIALAVLIYLPFPALRALFILPGIAWFALILVPVVGVTVFLMVHVLPEKIAHKRNHPQLSAIKCLCLLSLVFGGLLWPIAWLWAYSKPVLHKMAYGTDEGESHAGHDADDAEPTEVERLRARIAVLEAQINGGKS